MFAVLRSFVKVIFLTQTVQALHFVNRYIMSIRSKVQLYCKILCLVKQEDYKGTLIAP